MTQFQQFLAASRWLGSQPDLVQGGGGNTSFKLNDELMAIKASGFLLSEMTENNAYTVVKHAPIVQYFNENIAQEPTKDQENKASKFVSECLDNSGTYPNLRPSMETGFHAVLEKVVYHTHSVYSNLVNCSENAAVLLSEIFAGTAIQPIFIPYANPGFGLSQSILQAKIDFMAANGFAPEVFFLENHGLVSTGNDIEKTLALDKKVNDILKKYFGINEEYPKLTIASTTPQVFESQNETLAKWLVQIDLHNDFFERVLFPDQVVFFSGNVAIGEQISAKKININPKNGQVVYQVATLKEAVTLEETLMAYMFLIGRIETPRFIGGTQAEYINNMESEAYRRSLLKK